MKAGVGDEVRVGCDGGMEELERLFRISPSSPSLDAIIVSIDLETSGSKGRSLRANRKEIEGVREVGFAVLDTRVILPHLRRQKVLDENMEGSMSRSRPDFSPESEPPMVLTQQFSTSHSSRDFEDCDTTDFKECVFSETRYVAKDHLVDTITRCLQFPEDATDQESNIADEDNNKGNDEDYRESPGLRTVVIVGHSPQRDLEIIRRLGVSVSRVVPVAAILDTHRLSRNILGPDSPLGKDAPLRKHALSDVLTELGVPYDWYDLHNAGNDATYTLYALIMLAARRAGYSGMTAAAARLRAFAEGEVAAPRWTPVRRALGAHRGEEEPREPVKRLGSGLAAVAKSVLSRPGG